MKKYRLVKIIKANGFTMWAIQKKVLFWWEFVDCWTDEATAREVLEKLRNGVPAERREVIG
jgi:hypothetical protein